MSELIDRLSDALSAKAIPHGGCAQLNPAVPPEEGWHTVTRADGIVLRIDYLPEATGPQIAAGDDLAMTLQAGTFWPRPLHDIYADLGTLTGAQMTAIWNDLMSGNPHKLSLDTGPNTAAILVIDWVANWSTTITAADRTEGKKRAIVMYVGDNPWYLVKPSFDQSINIAGEAPA